MLDGVMQNPFGAQHPDVHVALQLPASFALGTTHAPAWQTSDEEHATHTAPWAPQADAVRPVSQTPLALQQPLQLLGAQPGAVAGPEHEAAMGTAAPTAHAAKKMRSSLIRGALRAKENERLR
jgi:hypothetical protein